MQRRRGNAWPAFTQRAASSWFSVVFKTCTQIWGPVASSREFEHLILRLYLTAFVEAGSHYGKLTSAEPLVCTGTALLAQGGVES